MNDVDLIAKYHLCWCSLWDKLVCFSHKILYPGRMQVSFSLCNESDKQQRSSPGILSAYNWRSWLLTKWNVTKQNIFWQKKRSCGYVSLHLIVQVFPMIIYESPGIRPWDNWKPWYDLSKFCAIIPATGPFPAFFWKAFDFLKCKQSCIWWTKSYWWWIWWCKMVCEDGKVLYGGGLKPNAKLNW